MMEENKIQIPKGWNKEILLEELLKKDLIKLDRGRVISSIDLVQIPGDYPVYSSSAQKNGFFGAYGLYDFDEELITWSVDGGGYFFYRPKHKFSVTNVSGILRILDKTKYDYKFLYYLLAYQHSKEIFDYVDKAHPSVIKKRYYIPEIDLTEQKKIAKILSTIDKAIEQTEALIAKYERIKIGLMQDLLTKGIDENGNIRSEETHEFKDSPLGRIPVEWDCDNILNYCTKDENIKPGPFGSSVKKEFYVEKGYKIYGQEQVISGNINYGNYFIDKKRYKSLKSFAIKEGDILLSCVGTIGNVLIIPKKFINGIINPRLIKITLDLEKSDKLFFSYLLKSDFINRQLLNQATGGTMPVLNKGIILNLYFIYPQKNEQKIISKKIETIETTIYNTKIQLQKLHRIKTALMQDLLSGKKRVTNLIKEEAL